jgi:LuxR family maltose regulon positive regulatory protein
MAKRYLGRPSDLSPDRLERAARSLHEIVPEDELALSNPSVQAVSSTTAVLTTKLNIPRRAGRRLVRPRIRERLQCGLNRPLTLVAAPAGFGKTTAVADWALGLPIPVAWVSLDRGDDEPSLFWTYALAALDRAHPGLAETPLTMLRAPRSPSWPTLLRAVVNSIAGHARDVVLVLDDYHAVASAEIHDSIAFLLEHPPTQLHLYLVSRGEPPLPLARLRARDQIVEVRADDLRFSPEEAAAFLDDVQGIQLPAVDVGRLTERTDGWAVGLQLAARSLPGHPDPAEYVATFAGSHRHVLRYLGDEVLAAQPNEVQDFLVRTAVLDRLCGPLCDALTGRTDGVNLLRRLEADGLFLFSLDDEGRWYRYDHLFTDLLRHRLVEEHPDEISSLNRKAADWLRANGLNAEAVRHLLAVPDPDAAATLIEQVALDLLLPGDVAAFLSLIRPLPEDAIACRPRLSLYFSVALIARVRLQEAEMWANRAERALILESERLLYGMVEGVRATLSSMRGDADGAIAHAEAARNAGVEGDPLFRITVWMPLGIASWLKRQMAAADAALETASRVSLEVGNLVGASVALTLRAEVAFQRGRLGLAADLCRQVIQLADVRAGTTVSSAAGAYIGLGGVLYQRNDLVGAKLAWDKALELGQRWEHAENQMEALTRLAYIHQARGQTGAVREAIDRAEALLQEVARAKAVVPWAPPFIAGSRMRLALRQGRLEDADTWIRERFPGDLSYQLQQFQHNREFEYLTLTRVFLAQGKLDEAARLLGTMLASAESDERIGHVVEILVVRSLVEARRGLPAAALATIARAVQLASAEGQTRVFLDEGQPLRALLVRLREREHRGSGIRRATDHLVAQFDAADGAPLSPTGVSPLIEPLSPREEEVLRLLAKGRSNAAIAGQLVVATSTVKTHLHHLFAKLGAADRFEAVARARELSLL